MILPLIRLRVPVSRFLRLAGYRSPERLLLEQVPILQLLLVVNSVWYQTLQEQLALQALRGLVLLLRVTLQQKDMFLLRDGT